MIGRRFVRGPSMAKRIRESMLGLAKEIGAVRRDGRPDWYAVAEHLAAEQRPELLLRDTGRRRGPQARPWRWLCHDVELVQAQRRCSIQDACGFLSEGKYPETTVYLSAEVAQKLGVDPGTHKVRAAGGRWKGMSVLTLERKYYKAKSPKST